MPRTTTVDPHEGWSDRARRIAEIAWQQACARGHDHIGPEHYLIAMLDDTRGTESTPIVRLVLTYLNVAVDQLRQRIDDAFGYSQPPHQHGIPTTPELWRVQRAARVEATLMGHEHMGTEHLLLGISIEGGSHAGQALNDLGATPDRIREGIYQILNAYGSAPPPDGPHHAVTRPAQIRAFDETIADLRRRRKHAIEVGDDDTAAALRFDEKQVRARRATAVKIWAPQVDVARVVGEVERLRAEVHRLMRILAQHGIDADQEDHTSGSGTQAPD